eukprot:757096-Hanusia_phi.AAC.3
MVHAIGELEDGAVQLRAVALEVVGNMVVKLLDVDPASQVHSRRAVRSDDVDKSDPVVKSRIPDVILQQVPLHLGQGHTNSVGRSEAVHLDAEEVILNDDE